MVLGKRDRRVGERPIEREDERMREKRGGGE